MHIIYLFIATLLVALFTTWFIIVLQKFGIRDWLITNCPITLLSTMLECDFCLSFWLSFIISLVVAIIVGNICYFAMPFFVAPICRLALS